MEGGASGLLFALRVGIEDVDRGWSHQPQNFHSSDDEAIHVTPEVPRSGGTEVYSHRNKHFSGKN